VSDCIVIIPTYNEIENIEKMIRTVFSLAMPIDVLIIDDGSPDGTATIVKELQKKEFPDTLYIVERASKQGLGTAYIAGFNWALSKGYNYICEMDADFSHNPEDLIRLINACKVGSADLAIGSRYISGVNVVNWPMGRVLMSYFASIYVRFITGMNVMDTTAGFKCYSNKVLETIDFEKIRFKGYAFQIEMKFMAWKLGFKLVEVPIIFTDRKNGSSKMSGGIFNEALWGVLTMKFYSIFKPFRPKNYVHKKNSDS
jgi:dolichol-phosphate mannosyltransferase